MDSARTSKEKAEASEKLEKRHHIEWTGCEPSWGTVQELVAENEEQTSSSTGGLISWSCEEESFCF